MRHCGHCHECGTKLVPCLDGEEWCPTCGAYRRYKSHGWATVKPVLVGAYVETLRPTEYADECPEIQASPAS